MNYIVLGSSATVALILINVLCIATAQADSQNGDAAPGAADRPAATEINEIVVTAQRRKQLLTDVGMTVESIDGQFLAERNINSVEDLTQIVSALSVTENADGTPVYTL